MSNHRVLVVSESLLVGGAERQAVTDASLLSQAGWGVTLASLVDGPLKQELVPEAGLCHIHAKNWLGRCLELHTFCLRQRFDLIHSHQMGANLISSLVGRALGIPVIVTEHGLQLWRNSKHRLLARLTYACARQVLAASEARLLEETQRSLERCVVIQDHDNLFPCTAMVLPRL